MKSNIGNIDKLIRIIVGLLIIIAGVYLKAGGDLLALYL